MTDLHENGRFADWLENEYPAHNQYDFDTLGEYESWKCGMRKAFEAGAARLAEVERERDARVAAAYKEAAETFDAIDQYRIADEYRALARPEETDALERIRAAEQKRVRHMLGAMILAVEEDADEEDPDYSVWLKHWMTKGAPTDAPHYGDCTNVPMSCHRCLWDRVFTKVDACLAAIKGDDE